MGKWLSLGGAGEFGDPRTARRSSQGAVPAAQGLQERSGLNRALSRGWGPFQGVGVQVTELTGEYMISELPHSDNLTHLKRFRKVRIFT